MTREQIRQKIQEVIEEEFMNYVSSTDLLLTCEVNEGANSASNRIMNLWDKGFTYEVFR